MSIVRLIIVSILLLWSVQCVSTPPTPSPTPAYFRVEQGDGSDLLDQILERDVLRVCVRVWHDPAFSPPVFRGASNSATGGALTGFEIELAHLIADTLDVTLELIETHPTTILKGGWHDQCEIALAALTPFDQPSSLTTAQPLQFSRVYGYLPFGLLVAYDDTTIKTLNDLADQPLAVLEHTAYERVLSETDLTVQGQPLSLPLPETTQLISITTLLQATEQLSPTQSITNPIKAIFGATPILQQVINEGWSVKFAEHGQLIGYQPLAIAIAPPPDVTINRLLETLNTILSLADKQGILAEFYYKWYDHDFSRIQ